MESEPPADLTPAQQFATAVLEEVERSDEVVDAFDRMPSSIQIAVTDEMGLLPDSEAPELTADQLEQFRSDAVGEGLMGEWGELAGHKAAIVRQRCNRMRNEIPESDRQAFDDFFDSLPVASQKAALRQLAG